MKREKGSIEVVEHEEGEFTWYCSCGAAAMQFTPTLGSAESKGKTHLDHVHGLPWKRRRLSRIPCPDCLKITIPLSQNHQSFGRFCAKCQKIWRPTGEVFVRGEGE